MGLEPEKTYLCKVGKRNVRIRRKDLKRRLPHLQGEEVHVILLDGRTFAGKVTAVAEESLTVRDANARWTSLKRHTHQIPLNDVLEVIFDKVTDY